MNIYKIQTNVPKTHIDQVRLAVGKTWAGKIDNYNYCSFVYSGTWYFCPMQWSTPYIWEIDQIESVEEYKIEFICHEELISKTIQAIKLSHPYEEIPIEISKLENINKFMK